jgi:hypothetical protein
VLRIDLIGLRLCRDEFMEQVARGLDEDLVPGAVA